MGNKLFTILLLGIFLSLSSGCRTAPVYNVTDASIDVAGQLMTMSDVERAIVKAGSSLGWQMKTIEPGLIVGTLHLRTHMAQVEVPYTTNNYSILYKASENLKYNGGTIHKNYNAWVQNLDRAIKTQLTASL